MSKLAEALSRMLWRYEKAKSFTESQSEKTRLMLIPELLLIATLAMSRCLWKYSIVQFLEMLIIQILTL